MGIGPQPAQILYAMIGIMPLDNTQRAFRANSTCWITKSIVSSSEVEMVKNTFSQPGWGAYSAPDPPSWTKGEERGKEKEGSGREQRGREGRGGLENR